MLSLISLGNIFCTIKNCGEFNNISKLLIFLFNFVWAAALSWPRFLWIKLWWGITQSLVIVLVLLSMLESVTMGWNKFVVFRQFYLHLLNNKYWISVLITFAPHKKKFYCSNWFMKTNSWLHDRDLQPICADAFRYITFLE